MGWYAHEQLIADFGLDWPDKMCYDWFLRDNAPNGKGLEWLDELQVYWERILYLVNTISQQLETSC